MSSLGLHKCCEKRHAAQERKREGKRGEESEGEERRREERRRSKERGEKSLQAFDTWRLLSVQHLRV